VETRSIVVTGMSCDHCANAIRAEIGKLPGVAGQLNKVDGVTATARLPGSRQPMVGAGWGLAWGLALMRRDRRRGIVGYTANRQRPPAQGPGRLQEQRRKQ